MLWCLLVPLGIPVNSTYSNLPLECSHRHQYSSEIRHPSIDVQSADQNLINDTTITRDAETGATVVFAENNMALNGFDSTKHCQAQGTKLH
jgi:hypothetical protein